jgi:hypothetical protein
MSKLFDVHADLERKAKRNDTRINESNLPQLWIFTPTASVGIPQNPDSDKNFHLLKS